MWIIQLSPLKGCEMWCLHDRFSREQCNFCRHYNLCRIYTQNLWYFLLKDFVMYPLCGYNGFIEKRMLEIKFSFYMNNKTAQNQQFMQSDLSLTGMELDWLASSQSGPMFIGYQTWPGLVIFNLNLFSWLQHLLCIVFLAL